MSPSYGISTSQLLQTASSLPIASALYSTVPGVFASIQNSCVIATPTFCQTRA